MDEGIKQVTKLSKKQSATKTIAMSDKAIKRAKLLVQSTHMHVFIMRKGTKAVILSGEFSFERLVFVVEYVYNEDIVRKYYRRKINRSSSGEIYTCIFEDTC